jgi:hypothetical protein
MRAGLGLLGAPGHCNPASFFVAGEPTVVLHGKASTLLEQPTLWVGATHVWLLLVLLPSLLLASSMQASLSWSSSSEKSLHPMLQLLC